MMKKRRTRSKTGHSESSPLYVMKEENSIEFKNRSKQTRKGSFSSLLSSGSPFGIPTNHTTTHQNSAGAINMLSVDNLLKSFGFHLTHQQLQQLETLVQSNVTFASANGKYSSSPQQDESIFRKTQVQLRSPTKSSRFWSFSRGEKRVVETKSHLQQINLREIEICQQIGHGGSSAGVFLVIVDGWSCAMKQLKRELVSQIDIRCFEREMDILYRLPSHPTIVRYLFHTSIGSELCLFMQLYSGTLREYLDNRRKLNQLLPVEAISKMALEIASGIQFLHSHGVIHRDIKVFFFFSYFFFLNFSFFFFQFFFSFLSIYSYRFPLDL